MTDSPASAELLRGETWRVWNGLGGRVGVADGTVQTNPRQDLLLAPAE